MESVRPVTGSLKTPARYRDVLALLKRMARDERVSSDGLRAILAGNIGEAYTQADIARTRELAEELGWELTTVPTTELTATLSTPGEYQEEIRRLHAKLRRACEQAAVAERNLSIAHSKTNTTSRKRHAQIVAAGVTSVDQAFDRLEVFRAYIAAHGACHSEECDVTPSCGCGADRAFRLATGQQEENKMAPENDAASHAHEGAVENDPPTTQPQGDGDQGDTPADPADDTSGDS